MSFYGNRVSCLALRRYCVLRRTSTGIGTTSQPTGLSDFPPYFSHKLLLVNDSCPLVNARYMAQLNTNALPGDDQQKQLEESELKDHIKKLHDYLVDFAIPKFFAIRHPWAIYNQNVYFENRLWDEVETAKGLDAYAWKLMRFRFGAILSYARSKLEVLGSRIDGKEITIHWRFSGLPQSAVFLAFWRFKPWKLKQAKQENSRVVEGISTLSVGSDRLIYKHIIDRLVLDRNLEESKSKQAALREKLAKIRNLEAEKALS